MEMSIAHKPPADIVTVCQRMSAQLQKTAQALNIELSGTKWVNPNPLKAEINSLKDLFAQLSFSKNYSKSSETGRQWLAEGLCNNKKFRDAAKNWDKLKPNCQQTIIRDISEKMQNIFSHERTLFPPKNIFLHFYEKGRPAGKGTHFERGRATNSTINWQCNISINTHKDTGFHDFNRAMDTVFHENLHAIHFALADYFAQCPNREKHLLKDDMDMLHKSRLIDLEKFSKVRSLYHAVPLERDAFRQSKKFTRELTKVLDRYSRAEYSSTRPAPR